MTIYDILEVFNKGEKTLGQVAEYFNINEEQLVTFINQWMETNKTQ